MSAIYGMVAVRQRAGDAQTSLAIGAAMSFLGPDGHGQWRGDSVEGSGI